MKTLIIARWVGILALAAAAMPASAESTVFVNVNVIPMDSERILRAQSVVVIDGIISEIDDVDDVRVAKSAEVVDGTDRYLMPGLAEMHAHVTATSPDEFDRLATLFVANGITTIRGMLGRAGHLELREELSSGRRFGPRLYTSGPSLNGRSVSGVADAVRKVKSQAEAGYDFIKIHPGLSKDEFVAIATTANELDLPYAGHVPVAAGLQVALDNGMATIDHLDGYFAALLPANSDGLGGYGGFFDVMLAEELDEADIDDIAAATAAAGTWNVPTQILVEQVIDATPVADLVSRPEVRYVSRSTVRDWSNAKTSQLNERGFDATVAARAVKLRRQLILALHENGAGLLLGSDSPQVFNVPGFATQRELHLLVEAGLSPYSALSTGTVSVAEFLGSNGGIVAEGREADLVLLDADPLDDIENTSRIHGVMLRGRWLPQSELQTRLKKYTVPE